MLSKHLVTIVRDAPSGFSMEEAEFGGYRREDVLDVFQELEFSSLVGRIPQGSGEPEPSGLRPPEGGGLRRGESADVRVTIVDSPEKLDEMMRAVEAAPIVVVETEASSHRAMEAALTGLTLAVEEDSAYYVPLGHVEGAQLGVDIGPGPRGAGAPVGLASARRGTTSTSCSRCCRTTACGRRPSMSRSTR